jgi:hypothetical protein
MTIEELVNKIIPHADYEHRNGFNNIPIIDKLTEAEKQRLEIALFDKLSGQLTKDFDTLIVDTLAYLKSQIAVPILNGLLTNSSDNMDKLIIASSIFEISQENRMVEIGILAFKKMDNRKDAYYTYNLSKGFYYLIKFKNPEIKRLIEEYTIREEQLPSYNAKRALSM